MGFVMGSSCYLQTPISNSQVLFSSSSQSVLFKVRNADTKNRRKRSIRPPPPMVSLSHENPNEDVSSNRRAVLLVGISIIPFLQLRATALEGRTLSKSPINVFIFNCFYPEIFDLFNQIIGFVEMGYF